MCEGHVVSAATLAPKAQRAQTGGTPLPERGGSAGPRSADARPPPAPAPSGARRPAAARPPRGCSGRSPCSSADVPHAEGPS